MTKEKPPVSVIGTLRQIAFISGFFAALLCFLLIVNWFQLQRADPLNSRALQSLNERLAANPDDQQLRDDVRTLDLLSRKAYFTSQWQIRTGGWFLLISLLVMVICLQTIGYIRKKMPDLPGTTPESYWIEQRINRRWIIASGTGILIISLLVAFFSYRQSGFTIDGTAVSDSTDSPGLPKAATSGGKAAMPVDSSAGQLLNSDSTLTTADSLADGFPTRAEIIQNFPAFRGPGGNGVVYQQNIPVRWDGKSGRNILWKTPVPLSGYNSPVVWNDRVFLSGANEEKREVYCFDANTGKLQWSARADKIAGSPAKAPAVSKETGQAAPTLTTDGRRVYAIFANGDLIAFDFEGKKVWAKNLGSPSNHYGHSSSLIMFRDLLIVQYDQRGSAQVMAFSAKTGELVWKTQRMVKVSWSSPVVVYTGKRTELLLAAEPCVASYSPSSGKELWKFDCISGEVGPSVAYANGIVFSVNDYSKLAAVEIGDPPKLLWENSEYLSDVPSPVANDRYVFLITSYGTAVCYDARTGEKYWEHDFENNIYASPILAEGKVYIPDKNGIMHIFKADKSFSLIGEPALGEGTSCTPAMVGGRIYMRGDRNLYCIGK